MPINSRPHKLQKVLLIGALRETVPQSGLLPKECPKDSSALTTIRISVDVHGLTSLLPDATSLVPEVGRCLVNPNDFEPTPHEICDFPTPIDLLLRQLLPFQGTQKLVLRF